jgi:fermentation-respiration switch protein FrsA (DUF1100 family)
MPLTDNYIFELDENVTRKPVSYKNRLGIAIAADLYLPKDLDESDEHAAIVVGAPYGGVKEQGPGPAAASRVTSRPPTSSSRTSAPPSTSWARDPS